MKQTSTGSLFDNKSSVTDL